MSVRDSSGVVHKTLWPFGFSARGTSGGVVLVNGDGAVVAREGDSVQFGGGEMDNAGTWLACSDIRFRLTN
jgi:hypothetical protein